MNIPKSRVLCAAASLLSQGYPARAAQPGESFADPRAVSRDGKTHTGWVTGDGSIQAAYLDHASGGFPDVKARENHVRGFSLRLKTPLIVKVK